MIKAILFDVDGVLLDSYEANYRYFQDVLKKFGYVGPTREQYSKLFHVPAVEVIQKIAGVSKEEAKKMNDAGMDPSFPSHEELLSVPDRARETLKELHKKYKLGIVTSRVSDGVFESEDFKGLEKFFSVVVALEDTTKHKPNPEPLLFAAKKLGVTPGECVYIGDAASDKKAAKAAGMQIVIYSKRKYNIEPDTNSFEELPVLISKLK